MRLLEIMLGAGTALDPSMRIAGNAGRGMTARTVRVRMSAAVTARMATGAVGIREGGRKESREQ